MKTQEDSDFSSSDEDQDESAKNFNTRLKVNKYIKLMCGLLPAINESLKKTQSALVCWNENIIRDYIISLEDLLDKLSRFK